MAATVARSEFTAEAMLWPLTASIPGCCAFGDRSTCSVQAVTIEHMKSTRWKARLAAFLAAAVVNLVGVLFFLDPIAESDTLPAGPIVPPALGLLVYVVLSTALFDWTARKMGNAYRAALTIAISQFIVINVDFVLSGKRGLMTGAASTVLIFVTWGCVALAYSYFATSRNT